MHGRACNISHMCRPIQTQAHSLRWQKLWRGVEVAASEFGGHRKLVLLLACLHLLCEAKATRCTRVRANTAFACQPARGIRFPTTSLGNTNAEASVRKASGRFLRYLPVQQHEAARGSLQQLQCGMREGESTLATRGFKIWYSVVSPDTPAKPQRVFKEGTCTPLPIVVLHGGPGVPSDYLQPLKSLAAREQRKMFFYDQLGCGRSEGPRDESFYSVRQAAEDGARMLDHFADFHGLLDYGAFHILGHSWGGCLAVEMVLNELPKHSRLASGLASVALSNTPDSPRAAMDAARKLINEYKDEMWGLKPDEVGMPTSWPRTDEFIQQWKLQKVGDGGTCWSGEERGSPMV